MGQSSPTPFLMLPSEVIEAILISSRSPRTLASVAQTCRTLYSLVYTSPDSHLWRELFLTTWDDPRPALEHRALIDPRIHLTPWDWCREYRRRVSADKWLKAWRRDICLADDLATKCNEREWYSTTLSTLSVVLDTLLTLRPFPASPPIALTVLTPAISAYPTANVESGLGNRMERMTNAPPLPPLLIVLASGFSAFETSESGIRIGRMVYGPHALHALVGSDSGEATGRSQTPAWISTPSLPPQLVRTLLAVHPVGVHGLPEYVPRLSGVDYWGDDALGDVFHRIICTTGFVPIPPPLAPASTPTLNSDSDPTGSMDVNGGQSTEGIKESKGDREEDCLVTSPTGDATFPTPSQQHADARTLARRRVYDMQYLRGDRLWGPFHLVTKESFKASLGARTLNTGEKARLEKGEMDSNSDDVAPGRRRLRDTFSWVLGMGIERDDIDSISDDDNDDEDWHEAEEPGTDTSSSQRANQVAERAETKGDAEDTGRDPEVQPEQSGNSVPVTSENTDVPEPTVNSESTEPRTRRRRVRRSNPRFLPNSSVSPGDIKPEHLRPDYTYLASVRIVVEANLRELFGSEISDDVEMSETQLGGVGMFWEDEDEVLLAQVRSSEPGTSISLSVPSLGTTRTHATTQNTDSRTFELADILTRFQNLDVARIGSTSGYWSAWIEGQRSRTTAVDGQPSSSTPFDEDNPKVREPRIVTQQDELEKSTVDTFTTRSKGKGKASSTTQPLGTELGDWEIGLEGEACEGWDWAGVAGIWRRCVCWMDYRELLFYNLDPSKFITLGTQEACRIIPMELRITGYTRARLMPIYESESEHDDVNATLGNGRFKSGVRYFRPPPVIHFSGSSIGSDRGSDDGRPVRGIVQLIGGGEVRWQLDTYTQESSSPRLSAPEWSSEAVQIGGIGSAVGLLGMWTGAGHERADPLGPFWAWKVV